MISDRWYKYLARLSFRRPNLAIFLALAPGLLIFLVGIMVLLCCVLLYGR